MFFALVFALSIPIWLLEPEEWPITAAVGTPLLAGLLLAYRENGSDGVRRLLGRVFDWRRIRNRIWYLPALLLMPGLSLVSYAVMRLGGLPLRAEPSNLLLAVPAFFALFFVLAIGEEVGWTGYATDPRAGDVALAHRAADQDGADTRVDRVVDAVVGSAAALLRLALYRNR